MLEFGSWIPDQAAYASAGATIANNVLPLTNKSYSPLRDFSTVIDALTLRPQGAVAAVQTDGTIFTFCGDAANLYKLATTAFTEQSKSTDAYTTAAKDHWDFVQYGNNVIAVNGHTDAPQSYVMGSSTDFADLGGTPPQAKHAAVINNFVMLGNIDVSGTVTPNRVHWCSINDPTDWPTIGSADAASKQSDRQDLPTGRSVEAIIGAVGGSDGAIFLRDSIYRVTYIGSPAVFEFKEIERGRGTLAGKSVVNVGPFAFYIGEDGIYIFDGTNSTAIGTQKVDKYFFDDLDFNNIHRITGVADPVNKIVLWSYSSKDNASGVPNKLLMYNWETQRWASGDLTTDLVFDNLTVGYSMDAIDGFGNMETLTTPLDDRFWVGGFSSLSGFNSAHRLSTMTGAALAATITTGEFGGNELWQKPNERMYINGFRPHVDGGTTTVSLKYRDSPSGSLSTDGPTTVDSNGMAHFTRSCRYGRAVVDIAAGGIWTHAQGLDIDATPDGEN